MLDSCLKIIGPTPRLGVVDNANDFVRRISQHSYSVFALRLAIKAVHQ
jgi:hypothetical protein